MKSIKNKGFTLAEVLITLGIIGVVAALTAPALVQHASGAKIGPALSRGVSTLSNGFQTYMNENDASTVYSANPSIGLYRINIFQELADNYIKMRLDSDVSKPTIKKTANGESISISSASIFMFGDKSAVVVPLEDCNPNTKTLTNSSETGCTFYFLPVGWMSKDFLVLGEDAFELAYTSKGDIYIYGLEYGTSWTTACSDTKVEAFTPSSDKSSCGGRIAAHGFKKDY